MKDIDEAKSIAEIAEIEEEFNITAKRAGWANVKAVLRDMYRDPSHFIFELLQNAEDTNATEVNMNLESDKFIFTHDGHDFSLDDIKGICKAGSSGKTEEKKGKFGVGFKAVYKITDKPTIVSGEYAFEIVDYNVPKEIVADKRKDETIISLPFNTNNNHTTTFETVKNGLKLIDDSSIMFLDHIKIIRIKIGDESWEIKKKISEIQTHYKSNIKLYNLITEIGAKNRNYLLFQLSVGIGKIHRNLSIAYVDPKFDIKDEKIDTNVLSVFFPTELQTNLRFKINAPFNTTHTREQVDFNDEFNGDLLDKIVKLYGETILILKDLSLLNIDLIYQLAIGKSFIHKDFYKRFHDATIEVFNNNELLPSLGDDYVRASNALLCRDKKLFMTLLSEEDLKKLFDGRCKWIDGTEVKTNRDDELRQFLTSVLGVPDIEFNTLNSRLKESFFDDKDDKWLKLFYEICLDNIGNIKNNPKPIIRTSDNKMKSPFFGSKNRVEPVVFLPSKYVKKNPRVIKSTFLDDEISMNLFTALGIKEADSLELIQFEWIPLLLESKDAIFSTDILSEMFNIIIKEEQDKRIKIIQSISQLGFIPVTYANDTEVYFVAPTLAYLRTDRLSRILEGIKVPYVSEEFQKKYDEDEKFRVIADKLGINKGLRVYMQIYSGVYSLPKKVKDEVAEKIKDKNISPQKAQKVTDYKIEFLDEILNTITDEKSKILWEEVKSIHPKYYYLNYTLGLTYTYGDTEGRLSSDFIDELNKRDSVFISGVKTNISKITEKEFSGFYGKPNDELAKFLKFKELENLSGLTQITQEKIEITKDRTVEDVNLALQLLDEKRRKEKISLLKGEYLIDVFERFLNISLTEKEKERIMNIDYASFNQYSYQHIIFTLLKFNKIDFVEFNGVSELKFNPITYFDAELTKMLLTNESLWVSTLFHSMKIETMISKKRTFSDDLTKYKKYEFTDLLSSLELSVDFDFVTFYNSIEFLKFNPNAAEININEEYNKNYLILKNRIESLGLPTDRLKYLLDYPAEKSYVFLGEFNELVDNYKSFLTKKDDKDKEVLIDNLNIGYRKVNTSKPLLVSSNNFDPTGTKLGIEKTAKSKSITGYRAERIVYKFLTDNYEKVEWVSENADSEINANGKAGMGYDLKYLDNGSWFFVEVKGSKRHSTNLVLHFSKNEIKFAQKHFENYQTFICNGVEDDNPIIENIGNLFSDGEFNQVIQNDFFVALATGFEVYVQLSDVQQS